MITLERAEFRLNDEDLLLYLEPEWCKECDAPAIIVESWDEESSRFGSYIEYRVFALSCGHTSSIEN